MSENNNEGEGMVRIKCNICKDWKNLNAETYEKMLKRFGFTRGFLFGVTHGIEAVITNQPITDNLSREETELAFKNVYVCQDCRNNKKETLSLTESLNRVLNLKKKENIPPKDDNDNGGKNDEI